MKPIPLPELAAQLRAHSGVESTYTELHLMVVDGKLPGCRRVRGRWFLYAPVAQIAEAIVRATKAA